MSNVWANLCRRFDPCVGIDVGPDTIRTFCSRDREIRQDSRVVRNFHYSRCSADSSVYGKRIRDHLGDVPSHCVIGIPSTEVFSKTVILPGDISSQDSRELRQWALSQVPIEERDIAVSFEVCSPGIVAHKVVLLAAVKRTRLEWYLSLAASASLTVERVTIRQNALMQGARLLSGCSTSGMKVFVIAGEELPSSHVFYDGQLIGTVAAYDQDSPTSLAADIRMGVSAWGFRSDIPITIFQIGNEQRVACPEKSDSAHEFFGEDVYAIGLAALGGGAT